MRLLGGPDVAGVSGLSARGVELVAYLATHPDGVDESRLRESLWPDRTASRGTFNNLVSHARSALGTVDGELCLPRVGADRRYRLHRSVRSDLAVFDERSAAGECASALALVAGAPFGGFDWARFEGLTTYWERRVVDVAHLLAKERMDVDDLEGALWATGQGLLAAPGDEQLFRDRMLIFDAAGNPAAVESVMAELLAFVPGVDPTEACHPETVEVYRRCGRGRHLRAWRPADGAGSDHVEPRV